MRALRIARRTLTTACLTYCTLITVAYCWRWLLPALKSRADGGPGCLHA